MSSDGIPGVGTVGSVAEEIAALAEALRVRGRASHTSDDDGERRTARRGARPGAAHGSSGRGADDQEESKDGPRSGASHTHPPGIDACDICPVCRALAALHTVSPATVTALADLVHQAEVTLRALAGDLHASQASQSHTAAPGRQDIPVDDLVDDPADDRGDG